MRNIWCICATFFCVFVSCLTAPTGVARWKRPRDVLQSGFAQLFQAFSTTAATTIIPPYSNSTNFEQLDVYGDYADVYDYNNTDFSELNNTNAFYEQVNDTREETTPTTVTDLTITVTKNNVSDGLSIFSFFPNLFGTTTPVIDVKTTQDSPTTQQITQFTDKNEEIQMIVNSSEFKLVTHSTETASSSRVPKQVKTDFTLNSSTSYNGSTSFVLKYITGFSTKPPKAINETLTTTATNIFTATPSISGTTNKLLSMIQPPTDSDLSLIKPTQLFTKTKVLSKVNSSHNFSVATVRNLVESMMQVEETTQPLLTHNSDVVLNKQALDVITTKLNYDTTTLSNLSQTITNVSLAETEKITKHFLPLNTPEASTAAYNGHDGFNVITQSKEYGRNRSTQDIVYTTSTRQPETQSPPPSITTSAVIHRTQERKLFTTNSVPSEVWMIPEHQTVIANQSFTTVQTTPSDLFWWITNSGQETAILQSTTSGFNWNLVTEDADTDEGQPNNGYEDDQVTKDSFFDSGALTDGILSLGALKHDGPALTFFKKNWLWFLVGVIVIIFVVTGMIFQICCNKFYLFYRREKSKQMDNVNENLADTNIQVTDIPVQTSTSEPRKDPQSKTTDCQADNHSEIVSHNMQHDKETRKHASTSEHSEPRRVEIYTGPCSLTSQRILCASNETSSFPVGTEKSYAYPALSNQQPQYIYQERSPTLDNNDATEVISVHVTRETSPLSPLFGDEAIIVSNPTDFERPALRVPKRTTNPVRPPKPKQYESKTVPKSTNYRDCKRAANTKRPWADMEQGPRRQAKSFRRQSTTTPGFQRADVRACSSVNNERCHPPRTDNNNKLKSFKKREELLRQLVKGFNEAELLQRKLDRTRKWTNKQNTRVVGENSEIFSGTRSKNNDESRDPRKSHRKDRPPPYEDVMSDVSSKPKQSTRRHRR